MCTCLPVRVESLWWMRGLRRLLRSLGTLPLVLDPTKQAAFSSTVDGWPEAASGHTSVDGRAQCDLERNGMDDLSRFVLHKQSCAGRVITALL